MRGYRKNTAIAYYEKKRKKACKVFVIISWVKGRVKPFFIQVSVEVVITNNPVGKKPRITTK